MLASRHWMLARARSLSLASAAALGLALGGSAFSHPDAKSQARMLVQKGRPAEAARALEASLQKHPEGVAERRLLIRVYASMGQMGHAQEQAQALASLLGPASPVPWVELGYALELSHRYDEALEQYDRAAEVAPRDPLGPLTLVPLADPPPCPGRLVATMVSPSAMIAAASSLRVGYSVSLISFTIDCWPPTSADSSAFTSCPIRTTPRS